MKRSAALAAIALVVAGCSSTVVTTRTVTQPPNLGPARGEGAEPQPTSHGGPAPAYHAASGCGIERWAVKTGTDPAASAVRLTPQNSTVAQLGALVPPTAPTDRLSPTETTTFHIRATVTAIKQEADSDYHLALSDGKGHTMIAESPAPSCATGSVFASQLRQVRNTINQACPAVGPSYKNVSISADPTGIGFFDRIHGQRGVAPNGIELHPLLAVTLHGHC